MLPRYFRLRVIIRYCYFDTLSFDFDWCRWLSLADGFFCRAITLMILITLSFLRYLFGHWCLSFSFFRLVSPPFSMPFFIYATLSFFFFAFRIFSLCHADVYYVYYAIFAIDWLFSFAFAFALRWLRWFSHLHLLIIIDILLRLDDDYAFAILIIDAADISSMFRYFHYFRCFCHLISRRFFHWCFTLIGRFDISRFITILLLWLMIYWFSFRFITPLIIDADIIYFLHDADVFAIIISSMPLSLRFDFRRFLFDICRRFSLIFAAFFRYLRRLPFHWLFSLLLMRLRFSPAIAMLIDAAFWCRFRWCDDDAAADTPLSLTLFDAAWCRYDATMLSITFSLPLSPHISMIIDIFFDCWRFDAMPLSLSPLITLFSSSFRLCFARHCLSIRRCLFIYWFSFVYLFRHWLFHASLMLIYWYLFSLSIIFFRAFFFHAFSDRFHLMPPFSLLILMLRHLFRWFFWCCLSMPMLIRWFTPRRRWCRCHYWCWWYAADYFLSLIFSPLFFTRLFAIIAAPFWLRHFLSDDACYAFRLLFFFRRAFADIDYAATPLFDAVIRLRHYDADWYWCRCYFTLFMLYVDDVDVLPFFADARRLIFLFLAFIYFSSFISSAFFFSLRWYAYAATIFLRLLPFRWFSMRRFFFVRLRWLSPPCRWYSWCRWYYDIIFFSILLMPLLMRCDFDWCRLLPLPLALIFLMCARNADFIIFFFICCCWWYDYCWWCSLFFHIFAYCFSRWLSLFRYWFSRYFSWCRASLIAHCRCCAIFAALIFFSFRRYDASLLRFDIFAYWYFHYFSPIWCFSLRFDLFLSLSMIFSFFDAADAIYRQYLLILFHFTFWFYFRHFDADYFFSLIFFLSYSFAWLRFDFAAMIIFLSFYFRRFLFHFFRAIAPDDFSIISCLSFHFFAILPPMPLRHWFLPSLLFSA